MSAFLPAFSRALRRTLSAMFSTDHKVVAKQYLWSAFAFLLFGGALAMLIRWQWAFPGRPIPLLGRAVFPNEGGAIPASAYPKIFTMHGTLMIFFALGPILNAALPLFLVPLQIGSRNMAFPWLSTTAFWLFALAMLLVLGSFHVPLGTAAAGWTAYPPLSTLVGTPGWGQTLVLAALLVAGLSTILGSVNIVTTVIRERAPGMTFGRLPLTIWSFFLAAVLNVAFVPALAAASLLDLSDRLLGTHFFIAMNRAGAAVVAGGDPLLYQHLFWLFGHPEVYILILPAWGIVSDLLAFFSRKPAFWYRGSVAMLCTISALSALVYGHHMFVAGMSPMLGKAFMAFTFLIGVPAEILVVNWLNTIWRGSIRLDSPMLYALGVILVFSFGGLTGIYVATLSTDLYFHDTMWVVGHFHFTMAAAALLGAFAGFVFWFPKLFGRMLSERLSKLHFWITFPGLCLVFGGQLLAGYGGQPRRLFNPFAYQFTAGLRSLNLWTSLFAFALFTGQAIFVFNVFYSLRRGAKATANPWNVGTLEWSVPSPPPPSNFQRIPRVVRGPHVLSDPALTAELGRDYAGQAEEVG